MLLLCLVENSSGGEVDCPVEGEVESCPTLWKFKKNRCPILRGLAQFQRQLDIDGFTLGEKI